MTIVEGIGDAEMNAYVDGQLDAAGRIEVEDHLSRHPELAARVMADLSARDALRLAFAAPETPARPDTLAAARKLERALGARRYFVPLRRLAAAAALFALGWNAGLGWTEFNRSPPDQTALLAKAAALGKAFNVRLPELPEGWSVVDASLATSAAEGPGVKLTFQTPEFGRLSLIARNTNDVGIVLPTVHTGEDASTVHWQLVTDRYDLTADLAEKPIEFAALELYQTLY